LGSDSCEAFFEIGRIECEPFKQGMILIWLEAI